MLMYTLAVFQYLCLQLPHDLLLVLKFVAQVGGLGLRFFQI